MRRAGVLRDFATARETGNLDVAPVIAGGAAGLVRDIPPASQIVLRTVAEAERLFSDAPRLLALRTSTAA